MTLLKLTRKKLYTVLITVFIICLSIPSLATVMVKLSTKQLVNKSNIIAIGEVVNKESFWNETKNKIYTVTTLKVKDFIKGKGEKVIKIRQMGGVVGEIAMKVHGNANLEIGTESILFLKSSIEEPINFVVGMSQGNYKIINEASKLFVQRQDLKNLCFAEPNIKGEMKILKPKLIQNKMLLNDFLIEIRKFVDES